MQENCDLKLEYRSRMIDLSSFSHEIADELKISLLYLIAKCCALARISSSFLRVFRSSLVSRVSSLVSRLSIRSIVRSYDSTAFLCNSILPFVKRTRWLDRNKLLSFPLVPSLNSNKNQRRKKNSEVSDNVVRCYRVKRHSVRNTVNRITSGPKLKALFARSPRFSNWILCRTIPHDRKLIGTDQQSISRRREYECILLLETFLQNLGCKYLFANSDYREGGSFFILLLKIAPNERSTLVIDESKIVICWQQKKRRETLLIVWHETRIAGGFATEVKIARVYDDTINNAEAYNVYNIM